MVRQHLITSFSYIETDFTIKWSQDRENNKFEKGVFYPDKRGHASFRLESDYYFIKNEKRYIFDAKYYERLSSLDYKQISYYFLLKHYEADKDDEGNIKGELETYNALILPTEDDDYFDVHFDLNTQFNFNESNFVIIAYYFNMIDLMKNYL